MLFALLFSGFYAPGANLSKALAKNSNLPETSVSQSAPIKVVIEHVSAAVISPATATYSCQSALEGGNFLQDASVINLNQPANCFTFGLAPIKPLPQIAVADQKQALAKISVLNNSPQISSPSLMPAPLGTSVPAVPAAVYVLGVVLVFAYKKLENSKIGYSRNIKPKVNFNQLQILRC